MKDENKEKLLAIAKDFEKLATLQPEIAGLMIDRITPKIYHVQRELADEAIEKLF